ncbi:alpha/beta hydrolase family protein [Allosalinactinospora lopnorensis]|uniref:S28 family serine protease n=1 Tax=Allosalinactinospora lopnorensis TaxID=1352348 RepID=UPI000623DCDB|nr:S28 family serine protease [Allosalinactinospora lopnorensis]
MALPLVLVSALILTAAPAGAEQRAADEGDDIADRLEEVPGLTVVAEQDTEPGFRHFVLEYEQPADHDDPDKGTFNQRMTLLHRGLDRPTVLHTSGYHVYTDPFRAEPTRLVDGNQLSTEQRFFEPSKPDSADYADLDIRQAAADHHRILRALDGIYEREWISTGASKGGMTSVYHRRFYPDDLDGTVAYVAPNDVDNDEDSAYLEFFDGVGTDPQCQQDLAALQREALERRGELVEHYEKLAAEEGWTFGRSLGSADAAFEVTVLDTPWAFWQYQTEERCGEIPGDDASADEIAAFLDDVYGFDFSTDQGVEPYIPYYYQAATQLGSPSVPTDHIDDLLEYPGLFDAASYLPDDIALPDFDADAMPDIDRWVRTRGEQLLFVDGEFDPWGAEPFHVREGKRDTMRFVAPEANHGASIGQLTPEEGAAATAAVRRWAGVDDEVLVRSFERVPALDDAGEEERERRTP